MVIVGCHFHSRYQQIAILDTETEEPVDRRLEHENGEARAFYTRLLHPTRVGMEAAGHAQWFERMLAELGHEPCLPLDAHDSLNPQQRLTKSVWRHAFRACPS